MQLRRLLDMSLQESLIGINVSQRKIVSNDKIQRYTTTDTRQITQERTLSLSYAIRILSRI